jgi:large subunit ribosomal protein LP0
MSIVQIFDNGAIFSADMLDIDEQTLIDQFLSAIKTVASISLATNFPTLASVSHSLVNAYKNLLAISLATEFEFEGSAQVRICSCFVMLARFGIPSACPISHPTQSFIPPVSRQ